MTKGESIAIIVIVLGIAFVIIFSDGSSGEGKH